MRTALRRGCCASAIAALLMMHGYTRAQKSPIAEFDVATIKPAADSPYSSINFNSDGFSTRNMTLQSVVKLAYGLTSDDQIVGGPEWMRSARYDINAKEDDETVHQLSGLPSDDRLQRLRWMIQRLIVERFDLSVHQEKRDLQVLVLSPAKSGAKLQLSQKTSDPGSPESQPSGRWLGLHDNGHGYVEGRDATVDMLAEHLIGDPEIGGRLVVNRTGLHGRYDFSLHYAPERRDGAIAEGPSLFTALEEQLGLRLKSLKMPVDVMVIDRVSQPSAN